MKVNDGLKVTAFTAIALAVWASAGSADASAVTMGNAPISPADIQTSGENQKVYIDVSKLDKEEVMFGMATKGHKSGKTTFKISAWDIFEVDNQDVIEVDLSKLSNIKDNFIAIKTDSMEVPIIVKIPAVPKAGSVTYNAASHELEFKVGAKGNLKAANDYEWRTPYSNWNSPNENDAEEQLSDGVAKKVFDEFKYQGATLYIRTPGAPKAAIKETEDTELKEAYDASNIDKKVTVYDAGSFPGKEVKLNIAKQANGPSVAAKYTSGTLTIPSSAEYRVVTIENGVKKIPEEKEWESNDARKSVSITDLLPSSGIATQGVLEVRTKENTTAKKPRAASKWTRIPLSNASELKVNDADGDIINSIVSDSTHEKILEIKKSEDNSSISITNLTDASYQIVIAAQEPKIDTKPTARLSKAPITIRNDKNGQNVYIRKAGDSRTKTWVSDYIKIGKVNF